MFRCIIIISLAFAAAFPAFAGNAARESLNAAWRFALNPVGDQASPGIDDSSWRLLDLPHDWAIEGDFSKDNPSGTGGGALPGGVGWYRRTLDIGDIKPGEQIWIDFDGAYMNSSVYVNGHLLGTRPYGYASFSYDLTPWLHKGKNTIAVKVDNSEQPNSRWYSGCGIYRNVWLRRLSPVHIPLWGQFVEPRDIKNNSAALRVTTDLVNASGAPSRAVVAIRVLDRAGQVLASASKPVTVADSAVVVQNLKVKGIDLWSPENPALYSVVTDVSVGGKVVDTNVETTGFRNIAFDADKGFFLNGKNIKINGVCLHHDAGALGAVVNRRAIERQLQIMKEMGANAIRSSHNPPAPELLRLCDSLGLMVMDETFDMWRKKKTDNDYARHFNAWHERDLRDLVVRDRNHPSIVMWSIGNEVLEQWSQADADTLSLEQANLILNFGHGKEMLAAENAEMSVNSLLTIKLADMVRELDSSRPVTAGCNEPDPGNHLFRSGALDIIGYNYHDDNFKDVPKNFPGKPFVITESVSGLMTRGYYRMPSDSMYVWPVRWDIPFEDPTFACSSYDNCHVPWGNTHEGTMKHVRDNDFIMGQFVWTGFDYIGEPTPFGWPARSSYFGIVDLAGFPKDVYYMYQSQWRPDVDVLHLFPHWNWNPGDTVDMWAYYNNADEVELFVNGRSQGVRHPDPDTLHASWRVTFEPGVVEAVSRRDGKEVKRTSVRTAGDPYAVRLNPDRKVIKATGKDLSYVTAEIVDRDGNVCPTANNGIEFIVTGPGRNVGVDNGCQTSLERFKSDHRNAFNGKALIIIESTPTPGDITVQAVSQGLQSAQTQIQSIPD